jgi:hypothetical protein
VGVVVSGLGRAPARRGRPVGRSVVLPAAPGRRGRRPGCGVPGHARGGVRLVLVEGLLREQGVRQPVELVAMGDQGGDGLVVALADDPPSLPVDELLGGGDTVDAQRRLLTGRRQDGERADGSDMPQRPTICRAMLVTWSRSLSAPVVTSP